MPRSAVQPIHCWLHSILDLTWAVSFYANQIATKVSLSQLCGTTVYPYPDLMRTCLFFLKAFVIASFFYLLLAYLGPTEEEQRAVFRYKKLEKWMW
jgi:hypothetical protein